jgi:hypothetical protein
VGHGQRIIRGRSLLTSFGLLQIMFVLFVVATVLWSVIVVKAQPNAHRIHQLMIVLVTFKSLTLLSQVRGGALAALWLCVLFRLCIQLGMQPAGAAST